MRKSGKKVITAVHCCKTVSKTVTSDEKGSEITAFYACGRMRYLGRGQFLIALLATKVPAVILSFLLYFPIPQEMTTTFADLVFEARILPIDSSDMFIAYCTQHDVVHDVTQKTNVLFT